jgi:hypothetical protein
MTVETNVLTLIRTTMQRPKLRPDLIPRRRLLDRLHRGSSPDASDEANQPSTNC